jgi:hypothetical protein
VSKPGWSQRTVLHLEPKRAAATVGYVILMLLALAVVGVALVYRAGKWPQNWVPDRVVITERQVLIAIAVAGTLALLFAIGAFANGRRWHMARVIERFSNDPTLIAQLPEDEPVADRTPAAVVPPLDVRFAKAKKLPKLRVRLRRVTSDRNVVGRRPLRIVFLRLFENQPRMRTFIEGAWREFGYVHLLRSAASVTRKEYRWAKSTGDPRGLFVASDDRLESELARRSAQPYRKGRYRFRSIGPRTIRVRDRYGSYPMSALLCHGTFWKAAVDRLLEQADLVVFDLSGMTERNVGTTYELQRVVDRFPIERVVFLADQRSKSAFLGSELTRAWRAMAAGSPNSSSEVRTALVVVTDYFAQSSQGQQQGQSTQVQVKLVSRRRQTRRVASAAQDRVEMSELASGGAPSGSEFT